MPSCPEEDIIGSHLSPECVHMPVSSHTLRKLMLEPQKVFSKLTNDLDVVIFECRLCCICILIIYIELYWSELRTKSGIELLANTQILVIFASFN